MHGTRLSHNQLLWKRKEAVKRGQTTCYLEKLRSLVEIFHKLGVCYILSTSQQLFFTYVVKCTLTALVVRNFHTQDYT